MEKAIEYEINRQIRVIEEGGRVVQETRLWDAAEGRSYSMRGKEEAHDYRYFPDPDLVPLFVDEAWVKELRDSLVELPDARGERFVTDYGLPVDAAALLTEERAMADWFEETVKAGAEPRAAANWIMGELMRKLNEGNHSIEESPVKPGQLASLLKLIDKGVISGKIAKTVFDEMYRSGKEPDQVVNEKGLVQISDSTELEDAVRKVLESSPDEVERFRAGDNKLMGFFVGQVMKATKGKANPKMVNELIRRIAGS